MSFFIKASRRTGSSVNSRKRPGGKHGKSGAGAKSALPLPKKKKPDVDITSDEDDNDGGSLPRPENGSADEASSSSSEDETAEQKKLRLAKQYLAQVEQMQAEDEDDEQQRHDLVAHRLKRDLLEQSGRLFKPLARSLKGVRDESVVQLKNQHRLPITRVALGPDEKSVYSASKDGTLVKWTVNGEGAAGEARRSIRVKGAHAAPILALALSTDGEFLATGCEKNVLTVWDPHTLQKRHTFGTAQHRGKITGLAFRYGSHQLFSCSADRSVKVWSLDEMAYVETLFGHEDAVTSIDSFIKERALSSGGRDGTLRLWKIPEESQLVFQGSGSSADCCVMLNDDTFASGHDDGRVYLWKAMKKKAVASASVAPGHWVTAIAAVRSSDLVAAGSSCGHIVLLVASNIERGAQGRPALEELQRIPCLGVINSLAFSPTARLLVAGAAQEHALGRWERIREAKNAVWVFPLAFEPGTGTGGAGAGVVTKQKSISAAADDDNYDDDC